MGRRDEIIKNLQAGAAHLACGDYLRSIGTINRHSILINAFYDRILRKHAKTKEIYEHSNEYWNQTMHEMIFRMMDVTVNRAAFEQLARIVPYRIALFEQRSQFAVEAMLLGASGLLTLYRDDPYILMLKEEFLFLSHKYDLPQMSVKTWKLHGIRPYNHPAIRLSQIATLLTQKDFLFNEILDCKTPKDVEQVFNVEASEYWSSHFVPADESYFEIPKRIGREKAYIFGINIVVPLQYAYGHYIGNDSLISRALTLAEDLPAENNVHTRRWARYGVKAANAFESQGLLQIATEYCANRRCAECPVANFILNKANIDE